MALKTLKGKTLAKQIVFSSTILSQMRGLMFARDDKDRALIMVFPDERRVSLHMCFVFFPIDILFLDSKKRIVEMHEGARPFITHVSPKHKAKYVIELSAGVIRKHRLKVGEGLLF